MIEVWKDIDVLNNDYQISSKGRVINVKTNRILKQSADKDGYCIVHIRNKTFKVHRLVCQYFLNNDENYPQVNHKDGNKQNNDLSNLEWCTQSHNMKHRFEVLYQIPYNKGKKMSKEFCTKISNAKKGIRTTGKKVKCVETNTIYDCTRDAERLLNIYKGCIAHCAKGYVHTAGGYHWQYV